MAQEEKVLAAESLNPGTHVVKEGVDSPFRFFSDLHTHTTRHVYAPHTHMCQINR